MSEWLAMGGHGFYIWSSYAMMALCVAVELWSLRRRRKAAWQRVDEAREEHESVRPARKTETE